MNLLDLLGKLGGRAVGTEDRGFAGTTMGKGSLYLVVGQASIVLSGYAVNTGLGHLLGPVEFGRFATIAALMALLETFFLIGIPMALGKHVAETGEGDRALLRRLGWMQLACSGLLLIALFGVAQPLAALLSDPGLAEYIRVIAWGMPASAAFQLYTRILNGLAAFGRQAAAIVLFSVLRLAFTFGFVALGAGTAGALWALVLTTALSALIAGMLRGVRKHGQPGETSWGEMVGLAFRFAILTGAVWFLATADQLFVKALAREESQAGFYAAAALFGKGSLFVAAALAAVVFPLAARSAASHAREGVAQSVTQSVRNLALLLLPFVALVVVLGRSLVTTMLGVAYGPAAQVLWVLVLGSTLLGLFRVLAMAASAVGGLRSAVLTSLLMGLLDGTICLVLIPVVGMVGAAAALVITALAGCLIMVRYITKRFGTVIILKSWGRIALSSAIVGALAYPIRSVAGVWLLLACVVLYLVHFGILAAFGEIRMAEVVGLFSVLPASFGGRIRRLRGD